jgi:hypothetical protein
MTWIVRVRMFRVGDWYKTELFHSLEEAVAWAKSAHELGAFEIKLYDARPVALSFDYTPAG